MCTDNTAMDFYALNFPFTLNLQLEPSNLPSVWCEREDEGKSASLKSCPRHQTVKSSDAQSQEKTRKMNLFFFFLAALAKQTPRHTDVWLLSDPSSTQPLTQDQETDRERFFRAGLTQTDVDFNEVGPTDCEHGSYTLQPIPPLIYRINTRATEVTMHQSRKKKKSSYTRKGYF